jgi:hypothetical protein
VRKIKSLAPIVLFVYNRPWHTQQTLEALKSNLLSDHSLLIIYSDGPKEGASMEQINNIREVRKVIREQKWCEQVEIIESEYNKGLSGSIISGVTKVVNEYGKIIVLEDDLVTSRGFLKYMNDSLELYSSEDKVGCIHAWNYFFENINYLESTFFLKGADCWGWATWKRGWKDFNSNGVELLNYIERNNLEYEFDRRGTHSFVAMLKEQTNGKNDSWAIRWHASLFIKNKLCLHPTRSIVQNIGLDHSGIHCGTSNFIQKPLDIIALNKISIQESDWFFKAYSECIKKKSYESYSKWQKLKVLLKNLYHQSYFL